MSITPIACLSDNYAYLVVCEATREAAVVDPSEAEPVVRVVEAAGVVPRAIWNTHHHFDHTGGNEALAARYGIDVVCGHASDRGRIAGQTRFLEQGDALVLGELAIQILHIPGHTLGAIAYVVQSTNGDRAIFTGDTMFHAGCGRLFEGSPAQMHASLQAIVAQGDGARVFPGHEYTVNNLRFARSIEPGNEAIARAFGEAVALRDRGEPTVGTTVARERATNPFLRTDSSEIRASVGVDPGADAVVALAAIRRAKDGYR